METITFSCPNGHQYTVPASFAGKKTNCKACGVAFVIPKQSVVLESPTAAVVPVEVIPDAQPSNPEQQTTASAEQAFPALGVLQQIPSTTTTSIDPFPPSAAYPGIPFSLPPMAPADPLTPAASAGDSFSTIENGTARLVAKLWDQRGENGIVELHLSNGSPILPEFYDPHLSDGTHGVFANHLPDGTVTLTAVRWDTVQKVIVRKVEGLPDGMFEDFET